MVLGRECSREGAPVQNPWGSFLNVSSDPCPAFGSGCFWKARHAPKSMKCPGMKTPCIILCHFGASSSLLSSPGAVAGWTPLSGWKSISPAMCSPLQCRRNDMTFLPGRSCDRSNRASTRGVSVIAQRELSLQSGIGKEVTALVFLVFSWKPGMRA